MNCEEIKLSAGALQDGDLEPSLKVQAEEHLLACPTCKDEFERARQLSLLLKKSFIPAPSAALDENVLREFRLERERRSIRQTDSQKVRWWQSLFVGSIAVPKLAIAATAVIIGTGIALPALIGRNASNFADAARVEVPASSQPVSSTAELNETDKIKIIEVPVFRDRIVKQVIYVGRKDSVSQRTNNQYTLSAREEAGFGRKSRNDLSSPKRNTSDSKINDSIAEDGYFTLTNLSVFQPVREMKTKIIKE